MGEVIKKDNVIFKVFNQLNRRCPSEKIICSGAEDTVWIVRKVTYEFYYKNILYNERKTTRQTRCVTCSVKLNAKEWDQKDSLIDDANMNERI